MDQMCKDLLDQAEHLATRDQGKPKQANLRRAISAAYYAVFHYLVQQVCKAQLGTQHGASQYRRILGRAFVHGNMKKACKPFAGGTLPDTLCKGLPSPHISDQIRNLASTFRMSDITLITT